MLFDMILYASWECIVLPILIGLDVIPIVLLVLVCMILVTSVMYWWYSSCIVGLVFNERVWLIFDMIGIGITIQLLLWKNMV